jgi:hypothetical protein
MTDFLQSRLGTRLKLTLQWPTASTRKCRGAAASGYDNTAVAKPADEDLEGAAIDAFSNLATATAVDHGIFATLTEANSHLTKQLEEGSQTLKEIRALLRKDGKDRIYRKTFAPPNDNYCWTHGYKIARNHTIENCLYTKNEHKREANKDNNLGGYQANKEWLVGVALKRNSETFQVCRTPPLLQHQDTEIVDSGWAGIFLLSNAPCRNKTKYINPLRVRLPNGSTMDSTHTASLDIPELSAAAAVAHVLPAMVNNSLLLVEKLYNEGYSVTFTIDDITIFNKIGKEILKGNRDLDTGLWWINLRKEIQHSPIASANNVYELRNTGVLVNYLHKEMFSPTKSALIKAVKQGHLATWPGPTEYTINKHLKLTPATAMEHMNQKWQNIHSTSKVVTITSDLEVTRDTIFCLRCSDWSGSTIHWFKWKISSTIQKRQLVCNSGVLIWLKYH